MRKCASIRRPATRAARRFTLKTLPLITRTFFIPFTALIAFPALTSQSAQAWTLGSFIGPLNPVKLTVNGKDVSMRAPALSDGREVYIPLDALQAFQATFVITQREETAVLTFANNSRAEIALARPGSQRMLPLSAVTALVKMEFRVTSGICEVRAVGGFKKELNNEPHTAIKDSHPSSRSDSKGELQKDKGNSGTPNTQHPTPNGGAVQPAQSPDNGTSVAVVAPEKNMTKTKGAINQPPIRPENQGVQPSGSLDGNPLKNANTANPTNLKPATPPLLASRKGAPDPVKVGAQTSAQIRIDDVNFEAFSPQSGRIRIKTSGKAQITTTLLREPSRLALDIPNSQLASEQTDWSIDHPSLSGIHAVEGPKPGTTRFVLDLSRLISYRVLPPSAEGIDINIGMPRGVGRKMSNLTVVVDAGHGGNAGRNPVGCSITANGHLIQEKHLTLAIAKRVQRLLEEEGVTVLMTRTTDTSLGLSDRPRIAIENNADLFLSIHIDDCGIPNSASGTTTYYHMDDANSRAFAHSIVEHIAQVSGLPSRRARSDRERFAGTGMGVLHCGSIPATLVEIGYINNVKDRTKIIDPEFQETVAQAIVEGIRGYTEGSLPETVAGPTDMRTEPMGGLR